MLQHNGLTTLKGRTQADSVYVVDSPAW